MMFELYVPGSWFGSKGFCGLNFLVVYDSAHASFTIVIIKTCKTQNILYNDIPVEIQASCNAKPKSVERHLHTLMCQVSDPVNKDNSDYRDLTH